MGVGGGGTRNVQRAPIYIHIHVMRLLLQYCSQEGKRYVLGYIEGQLLRSALWMLVERMFATFVETPTQMLLV